MLKLEESLANEHSIEFEYESIIADLVSNVTVQQMQNFRQHYNTSCFEHCRNVSCYTTYFYMIGEKKKMAEKVYMPLLIQKPH